MDIDRVVSFFRHRKMQFALMHCVGEYPTRDENLQLGQIQLLRERYGDVEVGYSTHERSPDNFDARQDRHRNGARPIRKACGRRDRHSPLNAYSANPGQVRSWLEPWRRRSARAASRERALSITDAEAATLRDLQRGVFARQDLPAGARLSTAENTFSAIPGAARQLRANDLSKYVDFDLTGAVARSGRGHYARTLALFDRQHQVFEIVAAVRHILKQAKVLAPARLELEISPPLTPSEKSAVCVLDGALPS